MTQFSDIDKGKVGFGDYLTKNIVTRYYRYIDICLFNNIALWIKFLKL